jgi:hypothetical protein
MSGALNKVFAEIADFTKTMGSLHSDFLIIVRRDIERFQEMTKDLVGELNWQGWSTLCLTSLSASFAIAGALIPKGGAANGNAPTLDPRLAAHDGPSNAFSNALKAITQKLGDNDFLRTTCKTTSKFFGGVSQPVEVWFRGTTTDIESRRGLIERVNIQDGQAKKSQFDQNVQTAQQAASRLLDSKSKGA